jgi:hypothetical protein
MLYLWAINLIRPYMTYLEKASGLGGKDGQGQNTKAKTNT